MSETRRSKMMRFLAYDHERDEIRRLAKEAGLSESDFMRRACLGDGVGRDGRALRREREREEMEAIRAAAEAEPTKPAKRTRRRAAGG